MNRDEHLLVHAMEECAELQQRLSKALRFGLTEIQRDHTEDNRQRILSEYTDLVAVMEMCGFTLSMVFDEGVEAKRVKVRKYLDHAREQGTLTE